MAHGLGHLERGEGMQRALQAKKARFQDRKLARNMEAATDAARRARFETERALRKEERVRERSVGVACPVRPPAPLPCWL